MNAEEVDLVLKQGREGLTRIELARLAVLRRQRQEQDEANAEAAAESWQREMMECIEKEHAMREEARREGP